MKFADRLVGKGIDTFVVVKLITLNLAWMVVLVVPMAVLVSTLMAFGGLSQNNEIAVMKASGISIYKMIMPPLLASLVVTYLLIVFNNDVLPDANHENKLLMHDISRKKPTLSLQPNVFSLDINSYALLARKVDPNSNDIFGLTIYDYRDQSNINIVTAKEGEIYFSKDQSKLIMDLKDGEIHEADVSATGMYRKIEFEKHRIMIDGTQFAFQETTQGQRRGDRELSASDMMDRVDSIKQSQVTYAGHLEREAHTVFYGDSLVQDRINKNFIPSKTYLYSKALDRIKSARNVMVAARMRIEFSDREINRYWVEIHKKYSIPFACVVFVLLGAPLGIMTRKGGFGVAASISLLFFLIYWAFLIGGEKLADRGIITPFWGMWAANILIGIAGVLLVVKSVREMVVIDFSFFQKLIPKQFRSTGSQRVYEDC